MEHLFRQEIIQKLLVIKAEILLSLEALKNPSVNSLRFLKKMINILLVIKRQLIYQTCSKKTKLFIKMNMKKEILLRLNEFYL